MSNLKSRQDRAFALFRQQGMMRLSELTKAGVTAATVSPMAQKGVVIQLSRGLYQLPDAAQDTHHALAQAAELVPNRVMQPRSPCLMF
jgi:hypothetical protein